ncbi:hypothetical protein [Roseicella aquatilis]|uniref:Uncharacterized protein n=1 Tax=Roseicella aquatilis TaxID=2527868 RepID=A0A4R4D6L2_9PROT|nr:hypothetical protein [Roseicella aquatilis]TCZ55261.1 hypothetical protein EXY23_22010 [Roseicella aquatilis]
MLDDVASQGRTVRHGGETLADQRPRQLFAPTEAARSTRILLRHHGVRPLHLLGASFVTGRFAAGQAPPAVMAPRSLAGYRVEGDGDAGVTGAVVEYGFRPTDQFPCLWLVTSNPLGGAAAWNGQGYAGLVVRFSGTPGPANQVEYEIRDAARP